MMELIGHLKVAVILYRGSLSCKVIPSLPVIRAFHGRWDLIIQVKAMGKKTKEEPKEQPPKKKGGCLKRLLFMFLLLLITYLGLHIFFLWQPAGKPAELNQQVMDLNIAGKKIFPAVQAFDMAKIAGRSNIKAGKSEINGALIKTRLETAIKSGHPVTFREEEINAWLSERLDVNQGGMLAPFVTARYIWVDFKKDEVEFIIERELSGEQTHMTSLFMRFERAKNGYSISRHASHIGQVRAPGGFARLIMPAFSNLADELAEEMELYKNSSGQLQIYDIIVEDGKITFDPRRPDQRE